MNFDQISEYLILSASFFIILKFYWAQSKNKLGANKNLTKPGKDKDFEFENLVRDKEREILLKFGHVSTPVAEEVSRIIIEKKYKKRTFRGLLHSLQRAAEWDEGAFDELWKLHLADLVPLKVSIPKAQHYFKDLIREATAEEWITIEHGKEEALPHVAHDIFLRHLAAQLSKGLNLKGQSGGVIEFPADGARLWLLLKLGDVSILKRPHLFNAKSILETLEAVPEEKIASLLKSKEWDELLNVWGHAEILVPLQEDEIVNLLEEKDTKDTREQKQLYHQLIKKYHPDLANFEWLSSMDPIKAGDINFLKEQLNQNVQLINKVYEQLT
jgi:hypothetical protein